METFLLEQSLETGYTDFLSRGLAPIALMVIFCLIVGLDRGEVSRRLVKIEVCG